MVNELEDACKRGILELILTELRNKYKNKIEISYPIEVRESHDEYVLDHTRAQISLKNEKFNFFPFYGEIQLHFRARPSTLTITMFSSNGTIKASKKTVGYPLQHTTQHVALTDPKCHLKGVEIISEFVENFCKDLS